MAASSNGGVVVVESRSEKGMFSALSFVLSCICTHNNPTFSLTAMTGTQYHDFSLQSQRMGPYLLNDQLSHLNL